MRGEVGRVSVCVSDRPCAAAGLVSYRCKGRFGWIMVGARDDADALREARRTRADADWSHLEVWDGLKYSPIGRSDEAQ